ncbi:histidinol-phosphate transaminase [Streptomyces sp. NRRL S-1868]|uniref:histidinol-phosphate transaminase n=1 Tax=Streptomyces sp. NRRL S-1868 TaxID=1463892 RepID=UPI00099C8FBE|nr:histidinol-phosphate transaminase [Streptomyces sp. NRRL S-1868]
MTAVEERPRTLHRLALNETPYPPLEPVRRAMAGCVPRMHRYPQFYADDLMARIAEWRGVPVESVVVGSGSVGVAYQTLQAFTDGPDDEVVYGWRAFDAYPIITDMAGARRVEVPLTPDGAQDLPRLLAAVTDRTRVVVLCNPHNPTGTPVPARALEEFLTALPRDVLVVLDEAYMEFAADDALPQGLDLLRSGHGRLVVLRTFSKAYGLAGLRIGYGVAAPATARRIRAKSVPYSLTETARIAVTASIAAEAELTARIATLSRERARLQTALRELGWRVPESRTNFLWLDEPQRCAAFHDACAAAGIEVRLYRDEGIRLTVGEPRTNDLVLETARRLSAS